MSSQQCSRTQHRLHAKPTVFPLYCTPTHVTMSVTEFPCKHNSAEIQTFNNTYTSLPNSLTPLMAIYCHQQQNNAIHSSCEVPSIFVHLKQISIFWTDFNKSFQYQIPPKPVGRELRQYLWTDKHGNANRCFMWFTRKCLKSGQKMERQNNNYATVENSDWIKCLSYNTWLREHRNKWNWEKTNKHVKEIKKWTLEGKDNLNNTIKV
jgi:hypothetical protein